MSPIARTAQATGLITETRSTSPKTPIPPSQEVSYPAQDVLYPAAPDAIAGADFRLKVLSSLKWQGAALALGQLISWGSTFVIVRLLAPGDYGLMAMATVLMSLMLMLSELGIGAAIVQVPEIDESDLPALQGLLWLTRVPRLRFKGYSG